MISRGLVAVLWGSCAIDQKRCEEFVRTRFGDDVFEDEHERADRVLEEAIELHQVAYRDNPGEGRHKALVISKKKYDKPIGNIKQEMAGVAFTLMAYAQRQGYLLDDLISDEVHRVLNMPIEHFRAKQLDKVKEGIAISTSLPDCN